MSPADGALLLQWRERKRLADDALMLAVLAGVMAVALPWFLRDLAIRLAPLTWSAFLVAAAYLAASSLMERITRVTGLCWALAAAHALVVAWLAFAWHLAGSLQHPGFLILFAIPVLSAGWTLRAGEALLLALGVLAAVAVVALANSAELRWAAAQAGLPAALLPAADAVRPFPVLDLPASFALSMLAAFAAGVVALALASQALAARHARVAARLAAAESATLAAAGLAHHVIDALPVPAALVYADTRQVAKASRSFLAEMVLLPESLAGRELMGLVAFSHPEALIDLIAGDGGDIPFAVYRVQGEPRLARIAVRAIEHGGTRYALVSFEDIARPFVQAAVLDADPAPALVLAPDGRVHYANAAARALWAIDETTDAAPLLRETGTAEDWWELGPRARRDRAVTLAGRAWQASAVALKLPGEDQHYTIVLLRGAR